MPCFDAGRGRVGREELDVEGVEVVDRDHAFAVVVEVLHQHLTDGVELAGAGSGGIVGEEVGLLFEAAHQVGELGDDGLVGVDVNGFGGGENEAEVEDELIAWIGWVRETDWVAEDQIGGQLRAGRGRDHRGQITAKGLTRNDER